ncbi:replication domain protein [Enterococcus faecium]|nr:replication domain protein [Enterococcus faecium]PQD58499.1 replication domain protein [Enterococcus faecalis]EGP5304886.1 replication domain protein [Enterococcus faecium]EGP5552003.1 replication domain protein [Enterococcus faecium]PQC27924.1 replication domain protein [Enterococcus faecium]
MDKDKSNRNALNDTDDEEKEDEDGFSIIAMWNWERKNYFIKE